MLQKHVSIDVQENSYSYLETALADKFLILKLTA